MTSLFDMMEANKKEIYDWRWNFFLFTGRRYDERRLLFLLAGQDDGRLIS